MLNKEPKQDKFEEISHVFATKKKKKNFARKNGSERKRERSRGRITHACRKTKISKGERSTEYFISFSVPCSK